MMDDRWAEGWLSSYTGVWLRRDASCWLSGSGGP